MKIKFGDIIIIFVILICSVLFFLKDSKQGKFALLSGPEGFELTMDLSKDQQYEYVGKFKNLIVVKNGEIFVRHSDCPDKTCVHSGKKSKKGQIICCLPNELIIRIIDSKEKEVDVISG